MDRTYLLEALHYDREAGVFTWRADRPASHFASATSHKIYGTRFAGKIAGCAAEIGNTTYIQIRVNGDLYLAHRLAWLFITGECPELVDHRNGDGCDNRFDNLRAATRVVNGRNTRMKSSNTSGVTGVYWNKQIERWCAEGHYTVGGVHRKKHLGTFTNIEQAAQARQDWMESQGNFTERHGRNK